MVIRSAEGDSTTLDASGIKTLPAPKLATVISITSSKDKQDVANAVGEVFQTAATAPAADELETLPGFAAAPKVDPPKEDP